MNELLYMYEVCCPSLMPTILSHHLALQVQVPHTSIYCAMWETKFQYCIHIFQELKLPDAGKRLHFYHWLCNFVHIHHSVLSYIFFSDEALFHSSGYISKQTYRLQSSTNPHLCQETSLYLLKVGLSCAMYRQIVGLIFFDLTLTAETYRRIITDFIALLEHGEVNALIQQDRACPHTTWEPMQSLQ